MKILLLGLASAAIFSSYTANAEEKNTDLVFSGYSRFGMHETKNGNNYVTADGQLNGNAAGRLGNEGNGAELQFTKGFVGTNNTKWDLTFMLDNWWKQQNEYGDVHLKKIFAGVSNVFESHPEVYLWAGRDFHQRPAQELNDYMIMRHDGQGGGFKNLNLGGFQLDIGAVGEAAEEGQGETGNYAVTSNAHDIIIGNDAKLSILMNYGFSNDQSLDKGITTYQAATLFDFGGGNKFAARYSDNSDNSSFDKTDGLTTFYTSWEGAVVVTDKTNVLYNLGYHTYNSSDNSLDRVNYSAIVRPTYTWNDIHSTWLELGYSKVDYDQSGTNDAWKATLSQNISLGKSIFDRPMLRLYTTVGKSTNEVDSTGTTYASTNTHDLVRDTVAVGAMFEAWW